jgi:hypothetical protein
MNWAGLYMLLLGRNESAYHFQLLYVYTKIHNNSLGAILVSRGTREGRAPHRPRHSTLQNYVFSKNISIPNIIFALFKKTNKA